MESIALLGIDLSKNVFQLHGLDSAGRTRLKRQLTRKKLHEFVVQLPACMIVMEACAGAHHLSRKFQAWGHEVKLIAPQFVTPFVQSNKNDAADAEGICEAASRPNMRFVPTKSVGQQDIQAIHRVRKRLVGSRTALTNELRGLLGEYGILFAKGRSSLEIGVRSLLDGSLPQAECSELLKGVIQDLYHELLEQDQRIKKLERQLELIAEQPECQHLSQIGGLGLISVTALSVALADPKQFKNGRNFAAWLGLVPRHSGTGGKNRILGISKRGSTYLRALLIHGARSKLAAISKKIATGATLDPLEDWAYRLSQRRGFNKATVALANKNARIAWALCAQKSNFKVHEAAAIILRA